MGCGASSIMFPKPTMTNYDIQEIKKRFPIINNFETLKEYIKYAEENKHIKSIYKYLYEKEYINMDCLNDEYGKLTCEMKPFNVFARYASEKIINNSPQLITKEMQKEWMICYNKKENDDNWNDKSHKNASMCGPDKNGPGHVFLTTKKMDWKYFNITTIILKKEHEFLEKMKEVAEYYVHQRKWKHYGLYFHCFPHNSVNSLHLHICNLEEKGHMFEELEYKNLKIDDALKMIN